MVKISQAEAHQFLENHKGEWFLVKTIADKMDINIGSCLNNLSRFRNHGLVKVRKSKEIHCAYEYSYKEHQDSMIRRKPKPIKELKAEYGNGKT